MRVTCGGFNIPPLISAKGGVFIPELISPERFDVTDLAVVHAAILAFDLEEAAKRVV